MNINLPKLQCRRCGHEWTPRQTDVRICPRCKSASWDKPKKEKKVA
jgi:Zn finger protein HypA/HybF involved in hydrogenase expression